MQKVINHMAAKHHGDQDIVALQKARDAYDLAARQHDAIAMVKTKREFHPAIARAGGNVHLEQLMKDLLIKGVQLEGIWHSRRTSCLTRDIERSRWEHDALADAILVRNVRKAEELAYTHTASFREPFLDYLTQSEAQELDLFLAE